MEKAELDKLVIKLTDYQAAKDILDALKDLQIMLKKDNSYPIEKHKSAKRPSDKSEGQCFVIDGYLL